MRKPCQTGRARIGTQGRGSQIWVGQGVWHGQRVQGTWPGGPVWKTAELRVLGSAAGAGANVGQNDTEPPGVRGLGMLSQVQIGPQP